MLTLGIDTATLTLSMALAEGARILAFATEPPPAVHSEILPARITALLAEAGATLDDVGAIVVGLGPGSFTGLRISLATAKGLCYARRIPLVGVSSLAAMAREAADGAGSLFVPCLDARKGEVYCAFYRRQEGGIVREGSEEALSPEVLAERLSGEPDARCFGLGREAYPKLRELPCPSAEVRTPDARALLRMAGPIPVYNAASMFGVEPQYVRPPEVEWTLRPKKGSTT